VATVIVTAREGKVQFCIAVAPATRTAGMALAVRSESDIQLIWVIRILDDLCLTL